MTEISPPRVFISYSWDSEAHKQHVFELAEQLRDEGIDCELDQYHQSPPQGWALWMLRQVKQADFVLMICTQIYYRRALGEESLGTGKGVKWEGAIITDAIFNSEAKNEKFIPVLFSANDMEFVPEFVFSVSRYILPQDHEKLYRRLTNQPEVVKRPPGQRKILPPVNIPPEPSSTPSALPSEPTAPPIQLTDENPYNFWEPVTPPRFVGRTKEIQQLATALAEYRSLSVIGDWRIGKTSLLHTWAQQARQQGHVVVSLSGEDSAAQSLATFVEAITGLPPTAEPDTAADKLAQWSRQQTKPGLPPLLIIDEVETCLKRFEPRFFERLRGMLGTLILVLASWRELDHAFQDMGRQTSPFENRLGILRLGLLEPESVEILIQWGKTSLDTATMTKMRQYAGRHPFYLQLLGYHFVNAQRSGESFDAALDKFYQDASSRLRKLWHTLTEKEQQALSDSLQGKAVRRRSLRLRGLVTEDGQLFGKILEEWLREEL
jgi:hypothetical protein